MTAILANEDLCELGGVRQIAVVPETDAVGRIHEEGLRFRGGIATGGRITDMTDADVALQCQHVPMLEDVTDETGLLAQKQLTFVAGHDACGILATMLKHGQRIVDLLVRG